MKNTEINFDEFDEFKSLAGDNEESKVTFALACYLMSLQGYTTRQIADLHNKLPTHVTISKMIKLGESYFNSITPVIEAIEEQIVENKLKESKFRLKLNDWEAKSSLEMLEKTPEAIKEFPELYEAVKERVALLNKSKSSD